ncbi:hypothetical protein MKZ38_004783 [Zalerion maritima]|uniref:Uncharacterized protein n=1 Tax=Zalerion maritima TaxID=339359 RepID=A0AAD5RLJ6_9PEZI|nr:hypothetical protein MKZ38_004783 [Zalerion maritima]
MSTTILEPTPTASGFAYETLSAPTLATTWHSLYLPLVEDAASVDCLYSCPDFLGDSNPCIASYTTAYLSYMESDLPAVTEAAQLSSLYSAINNLDFSLMSCWCEDTALQPWMTAATGVCDHGSNTQCASPNTSELAVLTDVHEVFVDMCSVVLDGRAVDASTTATAGSAGGAEETGAGDSSTGDASGDASGDAAQETGGSGGDGDGGSGAGRGVVSLAGALLAGFVGACMVL